MKDTEVIEDMQIDGLKIVQDKALYRFTSDSVLLTRFARAKKGEKIADFCAGSGIVAFHFHALHPEQKNTFTLFELQAPLAALAEKTIALNDFQGFEIVVGRLQEIPERFREQFGLILCNPPYERAGAGFDNDCLEKAICRKELTLTLSEIARAAGFALKFGGRLCMLHRADRIAEVCYELKRANIEVKKIRFVGGKASAKPYLVMVEGVKGGKPDCEILPTIENNRGSI